MFMVLKLGGGKDNANKIVTNAFMVLLLTGEA